MNTNPNLTNCTSCGNEISKTAKSCPSCGAKVKIPVHKRKSFWFVSILAAIICIFSIKNSIANTGKSVEVSGETFTISEFEEIVENNNNKFSSFKGDIATVTGKVTKISGSYFNTNLNKQFDSVVVVENCWYFEVSSSDPILKNANIGDTVVALGEISLDLYGDVYCFGNSHITLK